MNHLGAGSWEQVAGGENATGEHDLAEPVNISEPKFCCGITGFTLIELLIVIAVIALLAALGISTLGGANTRGAEARARAEIVALSAAIESFKVDRGFYPSNVETLFTSLCPTQAGSKVYFEPRSTMLATNLPVTNASGNLVMAVQFVDPWGVGLGYSNATSYFELWSEANTTNPAHFIRN